MAYNSHFNVSLGMSSFQALTGRNMPLPLSVAIASNLQGEEVLPVKIILDSVFKEVFLKKKALQICANRYKNVSQAF